MKQNVDKRNGKNQNFFASIVKRLISEPKSLFGPRKFEKDLIFDISLSAPSATLGTAFVLSVD